MKLLLKVPIWLPMLLLKALLQLLTPLKALLTRLLKKPLLSNSASVPAGG